MRARLISREVVPFLAAFAALVAASLLIDAVLHLFKIVWIGRYLGIPGVVMILGSFGYSLRKRGLISVGKPAQLLRVHEAVAWMGSLLVLVHAGIHFNAILAWLAIAAMLINVCSGLVGKFLMRRSLRCLGEATERMRLQGLTAEAIEERLHWDSLTVDVMRQWRVVHRPIALAFAVLALAHILSVFTFWSWR